MNFTIRLAFNYFRKAGMVFKTVDEAYRFFTDMGFSFTRREFLRYWNNYFDTKAKFRSYVKRTRSLLRYWTGYEWIKGPEVVPEDLFIRTPIRYSKPYNAIVEVTYRDKLGEIQKRVITVQFDYRPTTNDIYEGAWNIINRQKDEYLIEDVHNIKILELRKSALFD